VDDYHEDLLNARNDSWAHVVALRAAEDSKLLEDEEFEFSTEL
jgi:hypothetical protein